MTKSCYCNEMEIVFIHRITAKYNIKVRVFGFYIRLYKLQFRVDGKLNLTKAPERDLFIVCQAQQLHSEASINLNILLIVTEQPEDIKDGIFELPI